MPARATSTKGARKRTASKRTSAKRNTTLTAKVSVLVDKPTGLVYKRLWLSTAAAELCGDSGTLYTVSKGANNSLIFKPV